MRVAQIFSLDVNIQGELFNAEDRPPAGKFLANVRLCTNARIITNSRYEAATTIKYNFIYIVKAYFDN